MKNLILFALLALHVGCSSPGKINADAIDELVTDVTARHDAYVQADPALDPNKKTTALRSSDLLRKVVAEAKAATAGSSATTPTPPAQGPPK